MSDNASSVSPGSTNAPPKETSSSTEDSEARESGEDGEDKMEVEEQGDKEEDHSVENRSGEEKETLKTEEGRREDTVQPSAGDGDKKKKENRKTLVLNDIIFFFTSYTLAPLYEKSYESNYNEQVEMSVDVFQNSLSYEWFTLGPWEVVLCVLVEQDNSSVLQLQLSVVLQTADLHQETLGRLEMLG